MTSSEISDYSSIRLMRMAGFSFLGLAIIFVVLEIIVVFFGELSYLSIITSLLLSLSVVILVLSLRKVALQTPSIRRNVIIASSWLIGYIFLTIISETFFVFLILQVAAFVIGLISMLVRIISFTQLNNTFKRLSKIGYNLDSQIFLLYGWFAVLSTVALIVSVYTLNLTVIIAVVITTVVGEISLLFAVGYKLIQNSNAIKDIFEGVQKRFLDDRPELEDHENIVVEAVNLEKLFPVISGFFESIFSIERIKNTGRATAKYFSSIFSKERTKTIKELTREYFGKVFEEREKLFVHAVDDVSFRIHKRETFGLVGESGCGKSTTGLLLLYLLESTGGKIFFKGLDSSELSVRELKEVRRYIQIIFQNPYESLSPRFSILDIIAEPLRLLNIETDEAKIEEKVKEELESVGLIPAEDFIDRFPHELSGGQRQRVGVARAFILDPEFIVADEPVSMLDVSIRVGVLKIMRQLTLDRGTAFLFITHDLALARVMCDRIAVMYLGRIVEQGPTEELIQKPIHPYAKALIAGVPKPDPDAKRTEELPIIGEVPSGIDVPAGCRFNPRCPFAIDKCKIYDPKLEEVEENHLVACLRYKEINDM